MYITKVLNNSLLLAKDDNDEEIILMGKGIGHNYKAGSELNEKDIEKIFVLHDENIKEYYTIGNRNRCRIFWYSSNDNCIWNRKI